MNELWAGIGLGGLIVGLLCLRESKRRLTEARELLVKTQTLNAEAQGSMRRVAAMRNEAYRVFDAMDAKHGRCA